MENAAAVLLGLMIAITGMFDSTVQAAFVSVEDFEDYNLGGMTGLDLIRTAPAGTVNPSNNGQRNHIQNYPLTMTADRYRRLSKFFKSTGNVVLVFGASLPPDKYNLLRNNTSMPP